MTIEEILTQLETIPDIEKTAHMKFWQRLLKVTNTRHTAYTRNEYVFIGLPDLGEEYLQEYVDADLITPLSFTFPSIPEDELATYNSLIVMYDLVNGEGWPVMAMRSPISRLPESVQDMIADYMIYLYENAGFTTDDTFGDNLEIE